MANGPISALIGLTTVTPRRPFPCRRLLSGWIPLILALPVLWHGLLTFAARAAKPGFSNDPDYLIDLWETEDGLPENSATCMAQTPDGYLWFGTFNGLVRFDGVTFTVFNPRNTPPLPSAGIVNLHADRRGWLWVSTYDGLVVRTGTGWRVFGKEQGWTNYFARTFAERRNGDLLITTFDGVVLEYAHDRLAPLPDPPGTRGQGYYGGVDAADQWWVAQNRFAGRWDGRSWTKLVSPADLLNLPAEHVCAELARDGGWWLLLGNELRKYRGDVKIATVPLPEMPGQVWSLSEDSQSNLWICTLDRGVCRVSPEGRMRRWTKESGLLTSGTRFAYEDRECNVWVGTSGGGLLRFKPRRLQSFGFESGLTERVVRSVAAHPDGTVLIATYGGGLFRLGETGLAPMPFPGRTNRYTYVQSVMIDRDERIWAGTYLTGLWVSGPQGLRRVPKEHVPGDNVLALFQDSRGRIWAGDGEGVTVFDAGNNGRYGPEQGLAKAGVRCFAEDSAGVLWLSNMKGIFRLETDHFIEVRDDTNRSITEVGCFRTETDGTLWMGTVNDGLLRRKQGKLSRIDAAHGLPAASINGILEDGAHCIWMATSRGIVRTHRHDLESVADGRAERLNSQLLDLSDGLPSVECASGVQPTCARDARGRMWFATSKGVVMVDPARFLLNTNLPPLQIEAVVYHTARDKGVQSRLDATERRIEAPFADRLVLPAGSRQIEVHYTALGLTAPEKLRFQVRLDGQDSHWLDAGGRRLALFHELPPGDYAFRVRAANNDGVWNEAGASLPFTVRPFFWQTAWFGGLVAAGFLAAISVWFHRHTTKLDSRRLAQEAFTRQLIGAQESERARLARELHDDITQRLAVLAIDAGRIERVGVGIDDVVGTMRGVREGLVRLSEDVHALSYRLHSSLLEDLGLAEALKAECERFTRQESIPCDLKLQDVSDSLPHPTALCLFRITQEALQNVARHARAGAIDVTLRRLDDGLQLAIRDNGVGFDPSRKRERVTLGLAGMRERAHLLGGQLDIESAPGHGTSIVTWVPLGNAEG